MKSFLVNISRYFRFKVLTFILPNLKKVINKQVVYNGFPSCQQKTHITGKGVVNIGKQCSFGFVSGGYHRKGSVEIQARDKDAVINIGNNVSTNNNMFICATKRIEIGDNTLIGQNVTIIDFEAHGIHPDERRQLGLVGTIIIGKNAWIGNNVTILKNSEIGDNTIVAAGAVVSGKFGANLIIGGVPAKIIKTIDT